MTEINTSNNKSFYDYSPENFLKGLAQFTGLDSCCDVEIFIKYMNLTREKTIIDMGAGEGRVIDYLLQKFPGKIFGIEFSSSKYNVLKRKFQDSENITLIHDNILNLKGKFDYAVFSWSVFIEFSKSEQQELISLLELNINEKFFIDIPKLGAVQNGNCSEDNVFSFSKEWGTVQGYFPTRRDIEGLIQKSAFYLEDCILYQTVAGREREIYVISKLSANPLTLSSTQLSCR